MLDKETAKSIADKIVPSDPDWFEAMEVDADKCRELVGAGVEWATHAEEDWRIEHMGMLDMDCEIKSVNAKGAGIVIQVEPKGYMTPEDGSAEAARRKGGESNRRRNDRRWGHIDESIGRAVNQCELDGVPATRQNVAERMTMDGQEVTKENVLRWTRNDASTKWRVRKDGSDWILFCTDESWSAKPQEM